MLYALLRPPGYRARPSVADATRVLVSIGGALLPMSPPTHNMTAGLNFDLSIDPNPRFVSTVRRFVEEAFERLLPDPDAVFRVSMTAHELLENATKYSLGSRALLRFATRLEGEIAHITLSLINETSPAHIDRLRGRIDAIARCRDPFVHYQQLMKDTCRITSESGLGLARIAAEAEMTLGLEVKGGTVAIMASTRASTREKP